MSCNVAKKKPFVTPKAYKPEPTITVYIADKNKVENMKIEDYILGVVAGEVKNYWPQQVLEAQAIIARTFTLKKMAGGKTVHGTDASTDPKEFQAYNPSNINENIRKAVRATRGEVIMYNNKYINAYFHSYSGGRTATAKEGLNFTKEPTPYLTVVKDYPTIEKSVLNWSNTFSKDEIKNALKTLGYNVSDVRSIKIVKKGPSGRAEVFKIDDTLIGGPELRLALNPDKFRSTLITDIKTTNNGFIISGKGWGHGVGMSQWGANTMAKRGFSAEDIIKYYFRGVTVKKLWK
ncbi:stage II sporulation protein D [Caldanaerobius fijiensis DSM 17918]|uniref:Stage II sporulation protein D n=1 Tax=Caldanaerobius fijiensis DSM 17918 TaxID=1121256 RepID=A0A1M4U9J0_9THEO|nr:stage II sporulation protein D [Caldanaerobius fijiensis DSM 17918]